MLLNAFVVERNELESRFIKCLHQVQIRSHLLLFELLSRLPIQPDIVVIGGYLQLLLLLLLRELPCSRRHELPILVRFHVLSVPVVRFLNYLLVRVHLLLLVLGGVWLQILVVGDFGFLGIDVLLVELVDSIKLPSKSHVLNRELKLIIGAAA